MNQDNCKELFERKLVEHTEMCYSVAFALTRNAYMARRLTEEVVLSAWQRHDDAADSAGMKMELLTALRKRFIQEYQQPKFSVDVAVFSNGKKQLQLAH